MNFRPVFPFGRLAMRLSFGCLITYFVFVFPVIAAPIHDAAKKGDTAKISIALDGGADVNALSGGATPLYFAARKGNLDAARLLIERGADVDAPTTFGTALIGAVEKGRIDLVKLLLEKGANPNAGVNGMSAIHTAAKLSCFDCVRALVEAGADVNVQTSEGETPLHFARRLGTKEIAEYLLTHGVVPPRPAPIASKLAAANPDRGKAVFDGKCKRCHPASRIDGVEAGPPSLWNVVGRNKASFPDFEYSDAFRELKGTWTFEDLNIFISAPRAAVPGITMDIVGVPDETERVDLISYLRTLSDAPLPLP
jgi:cytochrome c